MKKIGITGGIGAGKSLVCEIFKVLGIDNYPADYRAKWLQSNDPELKSQIIKNFGKKAYHDNGELNRAYLSKVVFGNDEKLKILNGLVHPAVAQDFANWCKERKDQAYILKEAALLFETGSYKQLDAVINVTAPEDIRLERTLARDPERTTESVKSIMQKQYPEEKRNELADFAINNDGKSSLIEQVLALHKKLRQS